MSETEDVAEFVSETFPHVRLPAATKCPLMNHHIIEIVPVGEERLGEDPSPVAAVAEHETGVLQILDPFEGDTDVSAVPLVRGPAELLGSILRVCRGRISSSVRSDFHNGSWSPAWNISEIAHLEGCRTGMPF